MAQSIFGTSSGRKEKHQVRHLRALSANFICSLVYSCKCSSCVCLSSLENLLVVNMSEDMYRLYLSQCWRLF